MKISLKLTWRGQTFITPPVEFDDKDLGDEEYGPGEESNNEYFIEDFFDEASVDGVIRHTAYEPPDQTCWLCRGTGIGQHGDPNTSRCSFCHGSGIRKSRKDA